MKIEKLDEKHLSDVNKANQPFEIIGKIKPSFHDGKWTYTEELYEHPFQKSYPNDVDCTDYIDNEEKAIYLAYIETKCVGQIVIRKDWNKYAFIEDLCVAKSVRCQGIGTALVQKAKEWAIMHELKGLALETQDNNLYACRLYTKCGFEIGGVNTMLYKNFEYPDSDAFAVFWYLNF